MIRRSETCYWYLPRLVFVCLSCPRHPIKNPRFAQTRKLARSGAMCKLLWLSIAGLQKILVGSGTGTGFPNMVLRLPGWQRFRRGPDRVRVSLRVLVEWVLSVLDSTDAHHDCIRFGHGYCWDKSSGEPSSDARKGPTILQNEAKHSP